MHDGCVGGVYALRSVHSGMLSMCKYISYLYSIRMESCIHRVARGEFIPASSFDFTSRRMLSRSRRGGWGEETEWDDTPHVYIYMDVCVYTCVYMCATCVAFAPVILNVREDISILVGKHTNSIRPFACISCAHMLVPLHILTQSSGISRKGPWKMLSLRLLTSRMCRLELSRDTNTIFQSVRKIRHFPYIRLAHPIAKLRLDWISRLENNMRTLLYLALIHFLSAFVF